MDAVDKLLASGADPNRATPQARSRSPELPLHAAAKRGHAAVTRSLLRAGASTFKLSKSCLFPLHMAASSGDVETVRALLEGGADVDITGMEDFAPPLFEALRAADREEECGTVAGILLRAGADPNYAFRTRGDGVFTPLRVAIEAGCAPGVEALLEAGADPEGRFAVTGLKCTTPLHWASRLGRLGCVEALLSGGADPGAEESVLLTSSSGSEVAVTMNTPGDVVCQGHPGDREGGLPPREGTSQDSRQGDPAVGEGILEALRSATWSRSGWGRRGWLVMIRARRALATGAGRLPDGSVPTPWWTIRGGEARPEGGEPRAEVVAREAPLEALRALWDERMCQAEERASVRMAESRKKRAVEVSRAALGKLQRSFYGAVSSSDGEKTSTVQRRLKEYRRSVEEMQRWCAQSARAHLEATVQRRRFVVNTQLRTQVWSRRSWALELELSAAVERLTRGEFLPDEVFCAVVGFL